MKNKWLDEENKVYIIYQITEIQSDLGFSKKKAMDYLTELEKIGLIEKKRLGLGKPNVIYVKNFMVREVESVNRNEKEPESLENRQNSENHNSGMVKTTNQEFPESQFLNSENHNSGVVKTTNQEFPESQFLKYENQTSGSMKITIQEVPKSQSNKTDINKTDFNDTEYSETDIENPIQSYQSADAGKYAQNRWDG